VREVGFGGELRDEEGGEGTSFSIMRMYLAGMVRWAMSCTIGIKISCRISVSGLNTWK
jgi:hypothetical protein